ncbi:hypothetical protein NDU88_000901 [Pleurodeles waltl]|uniref:Uncharacterized protein n=1 Tax=Pleurodeles waltl TaxID=8319 RepID=A0AAV7Q5I4_PLEWA|nr:hypothetical protein NDU88_000901 [Pleurodeles waltl]
MTFIGDLGAPRAARQPEFTVVPSLGCCRRRGQPGAEASTPVWATAARWRQYEEKAITVRRPLETIGREGDNYGGPLETIGREGDNYGGPLETNRREGDNGSLIARQN